MRLLSRVILAPLGEMPLLIMGLEPLEPYNTFKTWEQALSWMVFTAIIPQAMDEMLPSLSTFD